MKIGVGVLLVIIAAASAERTCNCGLGQGTDPCATSKSASVIGITGYKIGSPGSGSPGLGSGPGSGGVYYASPHAINTADKLRTETANRLAAEAAALRASRLGVPGQLYAGPGGPDCDGVAAIDGNESGAVGLLQGAGYAPAGSPDHIDDPEQLLQLPENAHVVPRFDQIGDLCFPDPLKSGGDGAGGVRPVVIPARPGQPRCSECGGLIEDDNIETGMSVSPTVPLPTPASPSENPQGPDQVGNYGDVEHPAGTGGAYESADPAAVHQHSAPAAVYQHSAPAATYQHSAPAVAYQHSAPAAVYQHSAPAAEYQHLAPAAEYHHSAPAPVYQHVAPAVATQLADPVAVHQPIASGAPYQHTAPENSVLFRPNYGTEGSVSHSVDGSAQGAYLPDSMIQTTYSEVPLPPSNMNAQSPLVQAPGNVPREDIMSNTYFGGNVGSGGFSNVGVPSSPDPGMNSLGRAGGSLVYGTSDLGNPASYGLAIGGTNGFPNTEVNAYPNAPINPNYGSVDLSDLRPGVISGSADFANPDLNSLRNAGFAYGGSGISNTGIGGVSPPDASGLARVGADGSYGSPSVHNLDNGARYPGVNAPSANYGPSSPLGATSYGEPNIPNSAGSNGANHRPVGHLVQAGDNFNMALPSGSNYSPINAAPYAGENLLHTGNLNYGNAPSDPRNDGLQGVSRPSPYGTSSLGNLPLDGFKVKGNGFPLSFAEQEKSYNSGGLTSVSSSIADPVSLMIAMKNKIESLHNEAQKHGLPNGKDKYISESSLLYGPRKIPIDGIQEVVQRDIPEEKLNVVDKPILELSKPTVPQAQQQECDDEPTDMDLDTLERERLEEQRLRHSNPEINSARTYSDLGYMPVQPRDNAFAPRAPSSTGPAPKRVYVTLPVEIPSDNPQLPNIGPSRIDDDDAPIRPGSPLPGYAAGWIGFERSNPDHDNAELMNRQIETQPEQPNDYQSGEVAISNNCQTPGGFAQSISQPSAPRRGMLSRMWNRSSSC